MKKSDSMFAACPIPFPTTDWRCIVTRAVDGDTVVVLIDRGFFDLSTKEIRFTVDAYENNVTVKQTESQTQLGIAAAAYVKERTEGQYCRLSTHMDPEKYGRILGDLYLLDGSSVTGELIAMGFIKT